MLEIPSYHITPDDIVTVLLQTNPSHHARCNRHVIIDSLIFQWPGESSPLSPVVPFLLDLAVRATNGRSDITHSVTGLGWFTAWTDITLGLRSGRWWSGSENVTSHSKFFFDGRDNAIPFAHRHALMSVDVIRRI